MSLCFFFSCDIRRYIYPLRQTAKNRHKHLENSNTVMYFVIRMSESAQQVLWHFIYSFGFKVANEPWPDFSDMVRWQKIKLLRTRDDPMKKLSYHAQNLAI